MNLKAFIHSLYTTNGASLSIRSGVLNPKFGFLASYKDYSQVIDLSKFKDNEADIILAYIIEHREQLMTSGNFLGAWLNEGKIYLDVSKQFSREVECREFAIENKQQAYFAAENKQEILTKY